MFIDSITITQSRDAAQSDLVDLDAHLAQRLDLVRSAPTVVTRWSMRSAGQIEAKVRLPSLSPVATQMTCLDRSIIVRMIAASSSCRHVAPSTRARGR